MKLATAEVSVTEEVDGPACSIWLYQEEELGNLPAALLKEPWAPFIDKVKTMSSDQEVRGCRKGAKQVATLGPASSSEAMIEKLFLCGVDVFRLNFSHGEYEEKSELIKRIRTVEERYKHPLCIMADMQGPKQRCGKFKDPGSVDLVNGQSFRFDLTEELGDERRAPLPHPEILIALKQGSKLLLDDGKIRMRVVKSGCIYQGKEIVIEAGMKRPSDDVQECVPFVDCIVEVGGKLSARKGVNTPDIVIPISPITPKDRRDIAFVCKSDVDWIAMSFVQRHEDMVELRELIASIGGITPKILAKIEKPSAVNDLDKILEVSDGVMVARGDLGVEMNPEEVPFVQKDMIIKARTMGKPVIVATQMLESMISSPSPTRAECSDVANAILDGCDAVMLSGETAVGEYAAEAVAMQRRVVVASERNKEQMRSISAEPRWGRQLVPSNAILASAATLAQGVGAKAIVVFTATGRSVERLVQLRPTMPILAVAACLETARWLSMLHGVYATSDPATQALAGRVETKGSYSVRFAEGMEVACRLCRQRGMTINEDDWVVIVARLPLFTKGPLNGIRLVRAVGPARADGYGPETGSETEEK